MAWGCSACTGPRLQVGRYLGISGSQAERQFEIPDEIYMHADDTHYATLGDRLARLTLRAECTVQHSYLLGRRRAAEATYCHR